MRISCIYIIRNKVNGNYYLGSTKDFIKRKSKHLKDLVKNKHHSIVLQRAFNKYGLDNFEIQIFQFCHPEEKITLENYYLKLYSPVYNIAKDALAPMEGRKHSEETRLKFKNRKILKGKDHPFYGKKPSPETKEKQRLKKLGSKRSEQTKKKMSETAKRLNSISRVDRTLHYKKIIDSTGIIHESLTKCAEYWNISRATVCDILKGRHFKTRKGISFRYA